MLKNWKIFRKFVKAIISLEVGQVSVHPYIQLQAVPKYTRKKETAIQKARKIRRGKKEILNMFLFPSFVTTLPRRTLKKLSLDCCRLQFMSKVFHRRGTYIKHT
jgi:hypothetical protein